jgi:DNA ligase-1
MASLMAVYAAGNQVKMAKYIFVQLSPSGGENTPLIPSPHPCGWLLKLNQVMIMFISPMLLGTAQEAFDDDAFLFEPKIDGHRLVLSHNNGVTRLWTRHNTEVTRQYPELHQVPVDGDVILDGEVCCVDPDGNIDFELVMERFQLKKKDKIEAAVLRRPVHFVVFDILFHRGRDLRGLPYLKRRSILESVLQQNSSFSMPAMTDGKGMQLFEAIKQRSMEGIVAKRKDSVYVSRRSSSWLKIINWQYADVYLAGYRKKEFGWLAQIEEEGKLRPAGIIELVPGTNNRRAFYAVSKQLVTGEDKQFVYLEPRIKAKVKFRNWTRNNMLRSPAFVNFVV